MGDRRFVAAGVSSGSGVCFFFALDFAVFFDLELDSFLLFVFFFADFGFALGLGDSLVVDFSSDASGVSLGFGFGETLFFVLRWGDASPFGRGVGDSLGFGEAIGFGVSVVFALGFGEAPFSCVGVAFFFGFGVGLGDLSGDGDAVTRVFKNSARFSSSVCASRIAPISRLSAKAIVREIRKRTTAAERNRAGDAFKRAALLELPAPASLCFPVRAERLHSTFRQAEQADKLDTSR